ncbi:hypothetical protein SASPL_156253 [Salvia splendens]|uniref:Uncharacterized protein n=1 Tax=Salvia splendens TaxID=180675 RepID=A0A8X8YY41_SALSN|nr:hypothetical protein SASPL_156253 [Salvia splendens]
MIGRCRRSCRRNSGGRSRRWRAEGADGAGDAGDSEGAVPHRREQKPQPPLDPGEPDQRRLPDGGGAAPPQGEEEGPRGREGRGSASVIWEGEGEHS